MLNDTYSPPQPPLALDFRGNAQIEINADEHATWKKNNN
jgi:hypothetical protein